MVHFLPMKKTPYRTYQSYLTDLFGCRVQKISLDAGMTCPNRDGTKGRGGCVYCDARGSGTGAYVRLPAIRDQLLQGKQFLGQRYGAKRFIAYFQSFSNTYGPLEKLKALYLEALSVEDVVGLSIGTRPDCISSEILDFLAELQGSTLVWVEYGLQSFQPQTLQLIKRGHRVEDFSRAVAETRKRNLNICVHVILGLPGEGLEECLLTAKRLGELDIQGLKLHSLYVNRGTLLETWYRGGKVQLLTQDQYVDWTCRFLEYCPSHWIIQRLTGDPNPDQFIAPEWTLKKQDTLKKIQEWFDKTGSFQGARHEARGRA